MNVKRTASLLLGFLFLAFPMLVVRYKPRNELPFPITIALFLIGSYFIAQLIWKKEKRPDLGMIIAATVPLALLALFLYWTLDFLVFKVNLP